MNKLKNIIIKPLLFLFLMTRRSSYVSFGFFDKLAKRKRSKLIILVYHGVGNDKWKFSVDTKTFKKQINYLKKDYDFVNLKTAEEFVNGKKKLSKQSVVLTFDDGYKDILKLKHFLKKQNIKPALFLITDTKNVNLNEIKNKKPFLSKPEIKTLVSWGWEIGSHSNTHANLSELSAKELQDEISLSKKKLEKELGIPIRYFAYPRGKYTKNVLKYVKKAKYNLALTMDDGFINKAINPLTVPRIGIDRTHSFSEFKSSFSPSNILLRKFIKQTFVGRYL